MFYTYCFSAYFGKKEEAQDVIRVSYVYYAVLLLCHLCYLHEIT